MKDIPRLGHSTEKNVEPSSRNLTFRTSTKNASISQYSNS